MSTLRSLGSEGGAWDDLSSAAGAGATAWTLIGNVCPMKFVRGWYSGQFAYVWNPKGS